MGAEDQYVGKSDGRRGPVCRQILKSAEARYVDKLQWVNMPVRGQNEITS